jgi:large subunit ribosomal protein L25
MEKVVFKATRRTLTGKQVSQLRRQGLLPGVVYGHKIDATPITLEAHSTGLIMPKLTSSSIVIIDLEGKQIPALVREKQKNYIKNVYTHIDFQAVSLTEKLRTSVSLHFFGTAPAIKDFQAAIVTSTEKIEVEALPNDLPERIEVDLSKLAALGDAIHVRDLVVPTNVTVLSDADDIIVVATATKEEAAEEVAGAEAAEPAISVERGKKEEEK